MGYFIFLVFIGLIFIGGFIASIYSISNKSSWAEVMFWIMTTMIIAAAIYFIASILFALLSTATGLLLALGKLLFLAVLVIFALVGYVMCNAQKK